MGIFWKLWMRRFRIMIFEELWKANQENLIGKYIEAFGGCETGSVEYEALCEGIQALMANRQ